jgi:hypothetical protein
MELRGREVRCAGRVPWAPRAWACLCLPAPGKTAPPPRRREFDGACPSPHFWLKASDLQLFTYMLIVLTALLLLLHPTSPSRDQPPTGSEVTTSHVAAPLSLNGLSVGLTERRLSPTCDTHVALGLGTPTHPLAANCHSYLQH